MPAASGNNVYSILVNQAVSMVLVVAGVMLADSMVARVKSVHAMLVRVMPVAESRASGSES